MSKAWRFIMFIVLFAFLAGVVAIGVGFLTGADFPRVFEVLNNRFSIQSWIRWGQQFIQANLGSLQNSGILPFA